MTRREHWERLSESGWKRMAEDWLAAVDDASRKEDEQEFSKVEMIVTEMRFEAPFDKLWRYILLVLSLAETEEQIGQIGAAELEHLLGWQEKWSGADYLMMIEQEAQVNGKLNRALLTTLQYRMSDEVWSRVLRLKEQIKAGDLPLSEINPKMS